MWRLFARFPLKTGNYKYMFLMICEICPRFVHQKIGGGQISHGRSLFKYIDGIVLHFFCVMRICLKGGTDISMTKPYLNIFWVGTIFNQHSGMCVSEGMVVEF